MSRRQSYTCPWWTAEHRWNTRRSIDSVCPVQCRRDRVRPSSTSLVYVFESSAACLYHRTIINTTSVARSVTIRVWLWRHHASATRITQSRIRDAALEEAKFGFDGRTVISSNLQLVRRVYKLQERFVVTRLVSFVTTASLMSSLQSVYTEPTTRPKPMCFECFVISYWHWIGVISPHWARLVSGIRHCRPFQPTPLAIPISYTASAVQRWAAWGRTSATAHSLFVLGQRALDLLHYVVECLGDRS